MAYLCFHCRRTLALESKISRQDQCPHCGSDLHCCLNCEFYDEHAHNRCREPQAEYVSDREKANFCDFFRFRLSEEDPTRMDAKDKAKTEWEALFRKD